MAAYLGFESFESLADWVGKGDALRSRLGFAHSTPGPLQSSSSAKKRLKSTALAVKKDEARESVSPVEDSPLTEKSKGKMVAMSLSSRYVGRRENIA